MRSAGQVHEEPEYRRWLQDEVFRGARAEATEAQPAAWRARRREARLDDVAIVAVVYTGVGVWLGAIGVLGALAMFWGVQALLRGGW